MKQNDIRTKINFNMTSILDDYTIINQHSNVVSEHTTDNKYLVLNTELGYFNKLTSFIVGNKSSILFMTTTGEMVTPTIEEVMEQPRKYFMMYPLPIFNNKSCWNDTLHIDSENTRFNRITASTVEVKLDFDFGIQLGRKFANYKSYNVNEEIDDVMMALNGSNNLGYFWPNKNLITNSNVEFCLGLLIGYISEIDQYFEKPKNQLMFYIHENDNIYIFATLLNWLGANYVIHNIKPKTNNEVKVNKSLIIKLPNIYYDILNNILNRPENLEFKPYLNIVKKTEWFINTNGKIRKQQLNHTKDEHVDFEHKLNKSIKEGLILLPLTTFKFIKVDTDEPIYDFTMSRADATNYALPFTPILKNSDGDILTLSAIFSKEAIEDAKVFEPSHKEWFRNLNDGSINKYIKDDALLGLYALTKFI